MPSCCWSEQTDYGGYPDVLTVDNGLELRGRALDSWADDNAVQLHFIDPGKPTQNANIEIFIVRSALSDLTLIVWVFRTNVGSAQISRCVLSTPEPANPNATATFKFARKPLIASPAVPSNTFNGSAIAAKSILDEARTGAPISPQGGF